MYNTMASPGIVLCLLWCLKMVEVRKLHDLNKEAVGGAVCETWATAHRVQYGAKWCLNHRGLEI
jgi:hypothetical protein